LQFEASQGKQFMQLYLEKNSSQKRAGGVAQGVGPKFKPQYKKKRVSLKKKNSLSKGLF
jgi:hypothetical protein